MPLLNPHKSERDKRATRIVLGGVALVILGLGVWAKVHFFGITTLRGWGELSDLRKDPMADYDPVHGKLRSREDQAATTKDDFGHAEESRIHKTYDMRAAQSGLIARDYRDAALKAGWRLLRTQCSRVEKSVDVLLDKRIKGSTAQLWLQARLPKAERVYRSSPRPQDRRMYPERPRFTVELLRLKSFFAPDSPLSRPGTMRQNIDCHRYLDSPDLLVPSKHRTGKEMCRLFPLPLLKPVAPSIVTSEAYPRGIDYDPQVKGQCVYSDSQGIRVFTILDASTSSRAQYEDLQFSVNGATREMFLLDGTDPTSPGGVDAGVKLIHNRRFNFDPPPRKSTVE